MDQLAYISFRAGSAFIQIVLYYEKGIVFEINYPLFELTP